MNKVNITQKSVTNNVIWKFAEKASIQFVSAIVSTIVARFVSPAAYGVIALANTFISLLEIFVDGGLSNFLIQKKDPDDLDFSTVFFTNMIICSLCYILLFVASPFLSEYYKNSDLTPIIRILGLSLIIYGLKDVQHAYISKQMQFKKFFFASLLGTIIAGIIGIVMAVNNYGVWALVATSLIDLFVDTLVIWFVTDWRPKKIFSFVRLKEALSYSSKLFINSILGTIYTKAYQIEIANYYTMSDLAYYDKGEGIPTKLVGNLTNSINTVIKPVLSNYKDEIDSTKKITRQTIKISTYIMLPMLVGISIIIEPLVKIVFTEKWLPIVPYVRIMCVYEFLCNLININANIMRTSGRSDLLLKNNTIIEVVGLIILFAIVRCGVMMLAVVKIITTIIQYILFASTTKKLINYSLKEQIFDVFPNIFISFIMAALVFLVGLIQNSLLVKLILQILVGIVAYIALSLLFKNSSFYTLLNIIKTKSNK